MCVWKQCSELADELAIGNFEPDIGTTKMAETCLLCPELSALSNEYFLPILLRTNNACEYNTLVLVICYCSTSMPETIAVLVLFKFDKTIPENVADNFPVDDTVIATVKVESKEV